MLTQIPQSTLFAWSALIAAGMLEVVWAIALRYSDGFSRWGPSIVAIVAAALSFVGLSVALRNLPVGTAYAVWVGIGAVGVALAGILALGESASPMRLLFLAGITSSVVGLVLTES